ncbi:MAG: outer membrane beta-barrel protein [Bacteroides sp.]|jgi:hypothetical protein|nr:outer membrane beta-barrel protein [Bacteroides sp.]
MKSSTSSFPVFVIFLLIPLLCQSQEYSRSYFNLGYITNFSKCEECEKVDTGGSIRLGYLSKKKLGFYLGYLWFKEYHKDFVEYDDEGKAFLAGLNLRLFKSEDFRLYAQIGIENEKFIATYPTRTESETNLKPDFGLLINYKFINSFLGWQPSEPPHINIGLGITILNKSSDR